MYISASEVSTFRLVRSPPLHWAGLYRYRVVKGCARDQVSLRQRKSDAFL